MSNRGLVQNIRNPPQPPAPVLGSSKLFVCVMPIAQIVIGALHLNDCPRQPYIPIYLIVAGAFGLVLALLSCLPCAQEHKDGTANPLSQVCMAWNSLTSCFLFCWFIAGEFKQWYGD
ncbi:transmembrane protein 272-like [Micropterus dolomieu]|uniref:transmembrane protein 272-like n=1 Tax=Micropterus dolomieu TaxID=147949 RepID=UPI001E8D17D0|nr:transmembrane protein 272-like [Micropterus dolomieu]